MMSETPPRTPPEGALPASFPTATDRESSAATSQMQEITGETYTVQYSPETGTIILTGTLRLNGMAEYAPIADALRAALEAAKALTLDMRGLEFLNSSGIAMLSKFVIEVRNSQDVTLTILGDGALAWQAKSLSNLKRLMPALTLDLG